MKDSRLSDCILPLQIVRLQDEIRSYDVVPNGFVAFKSQIIKIKVNKTISELQKYSKVLYCALRTIS